MNGNDINVSKAHDWSGRVHDQMHIFFMPVFKLDLSSWCEDNFFI
jgi:hypothetical protein